MTREETIKILSVLRGAYPAFYRDIGKQEAAATIALWESMFDDVPYPLVAAAVKAFIAGDTKGFPPAIGQIKDRVLQLTQPPAMTEQEAWGCVAKALRNATYGSAEEFEKLPPAVRAVVHDPMQLRQWALADVREVQTVVASNFMRSYRAKAAAQRDVLALPASIRAMLPEGQGLAPLFGGEASAGASGNYLGPADGVPLLDAGGAAV